MTLLAMRSIFNKLVIPLMIRRGKVNSSKIYYGATSVNIKEQIETRNKSFIKLEYYGTKHIIQNECVEYGIEIVKKEYLNENFMQEINVANNVAETEKDLEKLITILKRNKVTPIGLDDVIIDLVRK